MKELVDQEVELTGVMSQDEVDFAGVRFEIVSVATFGRQECVGVSAIVKTASAKWCERT